MKRVVNELPGATHTGVADIWSLQGAREAGAEYVIRVSTLHDGGEIELPVQSVGRCRSNGRLYFSVDERFVRHHGFDCVWPEVKTVDLEVWLDSTNGRWYGAVLTPSKGELYTTRVGLRSAGEVEEQLREWCEDNGYEAPTSSDDDEDDPPPTVPFPNAAA